MASLLAKRSVRTLGVNLRHARLARRFSIADIASRAGVSPKTVQRLEKGDEGVGVGNLAGVTGPKLRKRTEIRTFVNAMVRLSPLPQPVEAHRRRAGVVGGVARVAVAEVVLDEPQIVAFVGECEAAGMAQHVGPDTPQTGALADREQEVVHRLSSDIRN
jgi:AraC-like DNA-binding protein